MDIVALLPLIAMALIFWLFIIRPASRRNKETARMQSSLTVGDRVMTTSGILATVEGMTDDRLRLRIADGVVIEVVRGAIGQVVPAESALNGSDDPRFDDADTAAEPNGEISLDKDSPGAYDDQNVGDTRRDV